MKLKVWINIFLVLIFIAPVYSQNHISPRIKKKEISISNNSSQNHFMAYPNLKKTKEKDTIDLKHINKINEFKEQINNLEHLTNKLLKRTEENTIAKNKRHRKDLMFTMPLKNFYVTSPYGKRKIDLHNASTFHQGIDLRASYEPFFSMLEGKVKTIGHNQHSGYYVIINSNDIDIKYLHLSKIYVEKYQKINSGDILGITGNSGISNGPHLHLQIEVKGKPIDPQFFIKQMFNLINLENEPITKRL